MFDWLEAFTKENIGSGLIALGIIFVILDVTLRLKFISLSLGALCIIGGLVLLSGC